MRKCREAFCLNLFYLSTASRIIVENIGLVYCSIIPFLLIFDYTTCVNFISMTCHHIVCISSFGIESTNC